MEKKKSLLVSILAFMLCFGFYSNFITKYSDQGSTTNQVTPFSDLKPSSINWTHPTVISDNTNGTINWNIGDSEAPSFAIDGSGNIHVAWQDKTNLEGCGTDRDIFYAKYSTTSGQWSHPQVISDNTNGTINWNTGSSAVPTLAVDGSGNIHVAWADETNLEGCGTDFDIFYAKYSAATSQ